MTEEEFMGRPMPKKEALNGARKFDNDKAPVTTGVLWRFPRAIMEVAKVSALGAEKYEVTLPDDNCLKVENGYNRYADADGRHLLMRALEGKMNTEKGGALPPEGRKVRHLAQHAWDALCILEMELIEEEKSIKTISPTTTPDYHPGKIVWIDDSKTTHQPPLPFDGNQSQPHANGLCIDPKQHTWSPLPEREVPGDMTDTLPAKSRK